MKKINFTPKQKMLINSALISMLEEFAEFVVIQCDLTLTPEELLTLFDTDLQTRKERA